MRSRVTSGISPHAPPRFSRTGATRILILNLAPRPVFNSNLSVDPLLAAPTSVGRAFRQARASLAKPQPESVQPNAANPMTNERKIFHIHSKYFSYEPAGPADQIQPAS